MSKDYLASDYNSINISLSVDGDEHIADGPAPNFWRVTQSDDQSGTGLILCMKCQERSAVWVPAIGLSSA
jgi:hypothetical protein